MVKMFSYNSSKRRFKLCPQYERKKNFKRPDELLREAHAMLDCFLFE